jgi:hypothetical protein
VSTREVGFTWGDLLNGTINMAGDAVGALIGRALGGPTVSVGAALAGAATNAFVEHATGLLPPDAQNAAKVLIGGAFAIGLGQGLGEVIGAAAGPATSWGAQEAGGAASGAGADQVGMGHGGTPLF